MSQPLWDNKKFVKLDRRQSVLQQKIEKFVKTPKRAIILNKKDGLNRDPKQFGKWVRKKTASKKDVAEYLAIKRQLKREFDY